MIFQDMILLSLLIIFNAFTPQVLCQGLPLAETESIVLTGLKFDDDNSQCSYECSNVFHPPSFSSSLNSMCFCGENLAALNLTESDATCDVNSESCSLHVDQNQTRSDSIVYFQTENCTTLQNCSLIVSLNSSTNLDTDPFPYVAIGNGDVMAITADSGRSIIVSGSTKDRELANDFEFTAPGAYFARAYRNILDEGVSGIIDVKELPSPIEIIEDGTDEIIASESYLETTAESMVVTLKLKSGSAVHLTADITIPGQPLPISISESIDVPHWFNPSMYEMNMFGPPTDSTMLFTQGGSGDFVFPYQLFITERGFLKYVELIVTSAGTITLTVFSTTMTVPGIDLTTSRHVDFTNAIISDYTQKGTIDLNVEIGYNRIETTSNDVELLPNDIIGIKITQDARIAKMDSGPIGRSRIGSNLLNAVEVDIYQIMIRASLYNPFKHRLDLTLDTPGEIFIKSTIAQEGSDSLSTTDVIYVQERITGYELAPIVCFINKPCDFTHVTLTGSNMTYNLSAINSTTIQQSDLPVQSWTFVQFGTHELYAEVKNMINKMDFNIIVNVDEELQDIELVSTSIEVKEFEEYTLDAAFRGGYFLHYTLVETDPLGVELELASEVVVEDGTSWTNSSHTRSFAQCGEYVYTFTVAKNYTPFNVIPSPTNTSTITVMVLCNLKDLAAFTTPPADGDGKIEVGVNEVLEVDVSLQSGADVVYNITWGDGTFVLVNHVGKETPEPFTMEHTYTTEGNFSILVVAANSMAALDFGPLNVTTAPCTFPTVEFAYGSEADPVTYTIGSNIKLVGKWTYTSEECKSFQKSLFRLESWSFTSDNNFTDSSQFTQEFDADIMKASLLIPRSVLPTGGYHFTYKMNLNGVIKNYYAYLKLIQSPLVVEIENGAQTSVPYFTVSADGNSTHYINFTIDAGISYDPDFPELGTNELVFEWKCRVVSDEVSVNQSVGARMEANVTLYEHTQCLSRELTSQGLSATPQLHLNTEMFLENITYSLELTVSKTGRSVTMIQVLKINMGDLPVVGVSCFKCGPKLNVFERTIFKYTCLICGNRELDAKWDVFSNNESIWTDDSKTTTGYKNPNLVISPGQFLENANYTFKLSVGYKGKMGKNVFVFTKLTSSTPKDGSCTINPKNGTAMDKFRIRCKGWNNLDIPLTYEFRYDTGAKASVGVSSTTGSDYPILNPMSLFIPEITEQILPQGLPENDHYVQLMIRINNKYGQYKELSGPDLKVKVFPVQMADLVQGLLLSKLNATVNGTASNTTTTTVAPDLDEDDVPVKSEAAVIDEVLATIQPTDPTDPQEVSSIVLLKRNILEDAKAKEDAILSLPAEIDPITGAPVDDSEEKAIAQAESQGLRQKANTEMIHLISNLTISDDPLVLKSMNDAVAAATNEPGDLDIEAKDSATDFLMRSAATMMNMTAKMSPEASEQVVKSLFTSLSNIMVSETDANKAMESKSSETTSETTATDSTQNDDTVEGVPTDPLVQAEIAKNATKRQLESAKKLVGTLDVVLGVINNNLVSGENATVVKTDAFDFNVQKVEPAQLSGKVVEGGVFVLPDAADIFQNGEISTLSVQNVNYEQNLFVDGETSMSIKSKVSSLNLKAPSGPLKVNGTNNPFIITLENRQEDLVARDVNLTLPRFLKYESIKVDPESCNMLMQLEIKNDPKNQTKLIVYIQYGQPPKVDEYDLKVELSHEILTNASTMSVDEFTHFEMNNSNIKIIDSYTFIMWNLTESRYGGSNTTKMYLAFEYIGPMPEIIRIDNIYTFDILEKVGVFTYAMKSFCSACKYWHEVDEQWSSDGCELSPNKTNLAQTSCKCNHLTNFGGSFVAPNPIPTPSLALLKEGYVLLVTIASMLMLYVIGLVFSRRSDKSDLAKVGIYPLIGNRPEDGFMYKLVIDTGTRKNAGTTSNIYFNLYGSNGESGIRILKDKEDREFKRGSSLSFVLSTDQDLGELVFLRIWHDNSGGDWYLGKAEVEDLQDGDETTFISNKWLSIDKDDCSLIYLLSAATEQDLTNFNYLFTTHSREQLSDSHIWFSVFARPPYSTFTRCQRLSVAMSLLFSVMLANIMFYGAVPKGTPETENNVRGFTFTWPQVMVGIQSAFITIPISILLVALFKSINYDEVDQPQANEEEISSVEDGPPLDEKAKKKKKKRREEAEKKKKKFKLPHWVLYPTWVLCVLVILGCAVMVILYGMAFGNKKSLEWLGSVSVGLIQDVILMQPLKVFIMAFIVAIFIKKLEKQERSRLEQQIDNHKDEFKNVPDDNLNKKQGLFDRSNTDNLLPPEGEHMTNIRMIKWKQRQMKAIVTEIMYYLIYAVVIIMLGFSLRDYSAFHQTRNLENMFELNGAFKEVITKEQVWGYIEDTVLTNLYPDKWYQLDDTWKEDDDIYKYPGQLYLDDSVSKIVTGARLRQLRVKPDTCTKADDFKDHTRIDCADYFSMGNEQTMDYRTGNFKRPKNYHGASLKPLDMPWRHQDSSVMDGLPVQGEINLYAGSGYAVEIFPKWDNKLILKNLRDNLWIDRHTRALFIEFAIVNIGTNYFDAVSIVFEFPPYGGVLKYDHVTTFRVTSSAGDFSFLILLAELAFLFFTILFVIREIKMIRKQSLLTYIQSFWNLVELSVVLLCFLTIFFTIYKEYYRSQIAARLPGKEPNKYINFQFAAMIDSILTYAFALICFFIVLKFVKLLRFNKRISMLARMLKRAYLPLGAFGIQFLIVLMAFTLSGTLSFGKDLYGYKDNWSTFASIIRLILGKFKYSEYELGDSVIGPLWFNFFQLSVNFIAINMYISILDDAMNEELSELAGRENEYEIMEYLMNSFKGYMGFLDGSDDGTGMKNLMSDKITSKSVAGGSGMVDVSDGAGCSGDDDFDYFRKLFKQQKETDDHEKKSKQISRQNSGSDDVDADGIEDIETIEDDQFFFSNGNDSVPSSANVSTISLGGGGGVPASKNISTISLGGGGGGVPASKNISTISLGGGAPPASTNTSTISLDDALTSSDQLLIALAKLYANK